MPGYPLLACAALVIVLAGVRAAADIVIPFLLSVFIAVVSAPAVFWLHRHRVPNALAILIVTAGIMGGLSVIGSLALNSLEDFTEQLPKYQVRLAVELDSATTELADILQRLGLSSLATDIRSEVLQIGQVLGLAETTLRRFGSLLTKTLLVFLTVLFMLLEASRSSNKLSAALGEASTAWPSILRFAASVKHYLAIKTTTSLATGLAAGIWVWLLDVDYAVFWGLLAFLFNYVPNVGSLVAAVPPVVLALLEGGLQDAALVGLGYAVINFTIGSLIEPQFMGDGLGLSPLIVFISLIFWGWLLGVAGALLAIPLTMSVKIALETSPERHWISVLMGSGKT